MSLPGRFLSYANNRRGLVLLWNFRGLCGWRYRGHYHLLDIVFDQRREEEVKRYSASPAYKKVTETEFYEYVMAYDGSLRKHIIWICEPKIEEWIDDSKDPMLLVAYKQGKEFLILDGK